MNTIIPDPPHVEFSPEQQAVLKESPEKIVGWVNFLKSLGFDAMGVNEYVVPENSDNEDNYVSPNQLLYLTLSPVGGYEKNLLFFGTSFATLHQFLEDKAWPEAFGDHSDQPIYLEALFFLGDRATIKLCGYSGDTLFDNDIYDLDEEGVELTWVEAAMLLTSMRKEILEKLKIEAPPATVGNTFLFTHVKDLFKDEQFEVRTYYALLAIDVLYLKDLTAKKVRELLKVRNFGKRSLNELKAAFEAANAPWPE